MVLSLTTVACKEKTNKTATAEEPIEQVEEPVSVTKKGSKTKLSLGQWSYHKELLAGKMSTIQFIEQAKYMDFEAVELVSQFFQDKVQDFKFLGEVKSTLTRTKVHPVMILVDGAGELGSSSEAKRKESVEKHKKWIKAASYLGCDFIRVNVYGDGSETEVLEACVKSLVALVNYGSRNKIQILIENHGGYSSDADWLAMLQRRANSPNVHILADFDNWCMKRDNGKLWGGKCTDEYDRYDGMEKILPLAKGISLKSFDFDEDGNETKTDFSRMFKLIKSAGYEGYLGIEYEGEKFTPKQGVLKTRQLAQRYMD